VEFRTRAKIRPARNIVRLIKPTHSHITLARRVVRARYCLNGTAAVATVRRVRFQIRPGPFPLAAATFHVARRPQRPFGQRTVLADFVQVLTPLDQHT